MNMNQPTDQVIGLIGQKRPGVRCASQNQETVDPQVVEISTIAVNCAYDINGERLEVKYVTQKPILKLSAQVNQPLLTISAPDALDLGGGVSGHVLGEGRVECWFYCEIITNQNSNQFKLVCIFNLI